MSLCADYTNQQNELLSSTFELVKRDNNITAIPEDVLNNTNIEMLDLSNNLISSVGQLVYLRNLRHIDLSNNKLKYFALKPPLNNLEYLNLSNNQIELIHIENSKALETLDISNNVIFSLNGLYNCVSLKTLNLSNNRITKISEFSYLKYSPLESLSIDHMCVSLQYNQVVKLLINSLLNNSAEQSIVATRSYSSAALQNLEANEDSGKVKLEIRDEFEEKLTESSKISENEEEEDSYYETIPRSTSIEVLQKDVKIADFGYAIGTLAVADEKNNSEEYLKQSSKNTSSGTSSYNSSNSVSVIKMALQDEVPSFERPKQDEQHLIDVSTLDSEYLTVKTGETEEIINNEIQSEDSDKTTPSELTSVHLDCNEDEPNENIVKSAVQLKKQLRDEPRLLLENEIGTPEIELALQINEVPELVTREYSTHEDSASPSEQKLEVQVNPYYKYENNDTDNPSSPNVSERYYNGKVESLTDQENDLLKIEQVDDSSSTISEHRDEIINVFVENNELRDKSASEPSDYGTETFKTAEVVIKKTIVDNIEEALETETKNTLEKSKMICIENLPSGKPKSPKMEHKKWSSSKILNVDIIEEKNCKMRKITKKRTKLPDIFKVK